MKYDNIHKILSVYTFVPIKCYEWSQLYSKESNYISNQFFSKINAVQRCISQPTASSSKSEVFQGSAKRQMRRILGNAEVRPRGCLVLEIEAAALFESLSVGLKWGQFFEGRWCHHHHS